MKLKQILLIIFAHRYVAALLFVMVAAVGVVFTLTTPKSYQATTDLLVDSRADPIAGAVITGNNYIATQMAILQSERLAIDVVKRLKLADRPEFVAIWQGATGGKTPFEAFFGSMLSKMLVAEPLSNSNVIRLTVEGRDPKLVTDIANTFAQAYLELTVNLRVEPARQYSEWFDQRLKSLRDNVERAQSKLSDFQRETGIVSNDQRVDVEAQRLDALMAQLVVVQGENMSINSRQKTSGSESSPDVQASSVVQGLRAELNKAQASLAELSLTLGPNHPQRMELEGHIAELKKQLANEINVVSGSTGVAKTSANIRYNELSAAIAAQKAKVLSLRAQRDQMAVLEQDVEAAKRIYDSVAQRSNQVNLEKQTDQANVSILSPAVQPDAPSKPNRGKYLVATIAAALAAAFGGAIGIEFLDRKVRVVEDLEDEDVPVIGVIERRDSSYTLRERFDLFKKFFTKRSVRKELAATSRLADLS